MSLAQRPRYRLPQIAALILVLGLSGRARADESSAVPTGIAQIQPPTSPLEQRALAPLLWRQEPGQGLGLGIDEGLWGLSWAQGIRVVAPVGRHFAVHARGLFLVHFPNDASDDNISFAGGRLDLIGRSVPLLNLVRLYGGGGFQVFAQAKGPGERKARFGGGGQVGLEFFHSPSFSFFLEVGGQGAGNQISGATILAGMNFFPWTS
jgi:hypothetical protein